MIKFWTLLALLWEGFQVFCHLKHCDGVWLNLKPQKPQIPKCRFKEVHSETHREEERQRSLSIAPVNGKQASLTAGTTMAVEEAAVKLA